MNFSYSVNQNTTISMHSVQEQSNYPALTQPKSIQSYVNLMFTDSINYQINLNPSLISQGLESSPPLLVGAIGAPVDVYGDEETVEDPDVVKAVRTPADIYDDESTEVDLSLGELAPKAVLVPIRNPFRQARNPKFQELVKEAAKTRSVSLTSTPRKRNKSSESPSTREVDLSLVELAPKAVPMPIRNPFRQARTAKPQELVKEAAKTRSVTLTSTPKKRNNSSENPSTSESVVAVARPIFFIPDEPKKLGSSAELTPMHNYNGYAAAEYYVDYSDLVLAPPSPLANPKADEILPRRSQPTDSLPMNNIDASFPDRPLVLPNMNVKEFEIMEKACSKEGVPFKEWDLFPNTEKSNNFRTYELYAFSANKAHAKILQEKYKEAIAGLSTNLHPLCEEIITKFHGWTTQYGISPNLKKCSGTFEASNRGKLAATEFDVNFFFQEADDYLDKGDVIRAGLCIKFARSTDFFDTKRSDLELVDKNLYDFIYEVESRYTESLNVSDISPELKDYLF